ncbi:hypothetical protein [Duganella sp. CF458]|uniref:hypothetical protein n=1 Tax=Duganella sp. CF458 TaxID=1884368 RepID=UPI00111469F8|nr:hypothetical protein [Duganella sp. CF458]
MAVEYKARINIPIIKFFVIRILNPYLVDPFSLTFSLIPMAIFDLRALGRIAQKDGQFHVATVQANLHGFNRCLAHMCTDRQRNAVLEIVGQAGAGKACGYDEGQPGPKSH